MRSYLPALWWLPAIYILDSTSPSATRLYKYLTKTRYMCLHPYQINMALTTWCRRTPGIFRNNIVKYLPSVHETRSTRINYIRVLLGICKQAAVNTGLNNLRSGQNGRHFPDDIFEYIFLNENVWIQIKSLNYVPYGLIDNMLVLVIKTMAWCRPGDNPLSEAMMT